MSYPETYSNLPNPNPEDFQNVVSHAGQHQRANDAIEAIEQHIGIIGETDAETIEARLAAVEALLSGSGGSSSIFTSTGSLKFVAFTVEDEGWLPMDGQTAYSKTTYADLWEKCGPTGSNILIDFDTNNFKTPDWRGLGLINLNTTDATFQTLGLTGGQKTVNLQHSHTVNDHTHTMQNHTHGVQNHSHTVSGGGHTTGGGGAHSHSGTALASGDRANYYSYAPDGFTEVHDNHQHSLSINGVGDHTHGVSDHGHNIGGGAHNTGGPSNNTTSGASATGSNNQLSTTQSVLDPFAVARILIKT